MGLEKGAQWLREATVSPEDPSSVASTHITVHTPAYSSSVRGSDALFWPSLGTRYLCGAQTYIGRQNIHKREKQKKEEGGEEGKKENIKFCPVFSDVIYYAWD